MELASLELRLSDAIDIAFGPTVVQVPLQTVVQKTGPNSDYRIACIVLNIKNLKANARKPIVRWGAKTQVVMYDRLFLCRDVSSGETFYILSEDARKTSILLSLNQEVPYIGSYVVIYQPRSDGGLIYGVPIITVSVPLIPATPQLDAAVVTPIKRDLVRKGTVESFLIEIADLVIDEATVVPSCGSVACDGRHTSTILCPGLRSDQHTTGRTFAIRMSSAAHQLDGVVFRSTRLAGAFMTPALLCTNNIKYTSLQGSVMAAMAVYNGAARTWLCHGYYKLQEFEEEEGSTRSKLRVYVARLEPRGAAPPNLVLYDGVEAAPVVVHVPMIPAVARDRARLLAPLAPAQQPPAAALAVVPGTTTEQQRLQRQLNIQRLKQNRQQRALIKAQKAFRIQQAQFKSGGVIRGRPRSGNRASTAATTAQYTASKAEAAVEVVAEDPENLQNETDKI